MICRGRVGSAAVEFAFVAVLLVMTMLGVVEIARFMIVSNAVSSAARIGERYAITRGANRSGTGYYGQSSSGSTSEVETVVRDAAAANLLDKTLLSITVTYPNSTNKAGDPVNVEVTYPYNPFSAYFPLAVTLRSKAQGIIVY